METRESFNTSHVVVYPSSLCFSSTFHLVFQYISCCSLSNHLLIVPGGHCRFQYISCCSLSRMCQMEDMYQKCFNTSHVVVYQFIRLCLVNIKRFQYISCCSLSKPFSWSDVIIALFQYISCCSLSYQFFFRNFRIARFNTSHVVVYRLNRGFLKEVY